MSIIMNASNSNSKMKLESCIKLIRNLPVIKLNQNINAISNLVYDDDDIINTFLQKIDNPLEVCKDDILSDFIKCEYNRDGDSYRSPYSNAYFPPLEDGRLPLNELREMELEFNKMFGIYTKAYYSPSTVSSCYLWELGEAIEDGFAVVCLIKNTVDAQKGVDTGVWDSCNLVTVKFNKINDHYGQHLTEVEYKLTCTVMLQMSFNHKICGKVSLSGSFTKQFLQQQKLSGRKLLDHAFHIESIGNMVEDAENTIRNIMDEIYIKKSKEIIDTARFNVTEGKPSIENAEKLKLLFHGK